MVLGRESIVALVCVFLEMSGQDCEGAQAANLREKLRLRSRKKTGPTKGTTTKDSCRVALLNGEEKKKDVVPSGVSQIALHKPFLLVRTMETVDVV